MFRFLLPAIPILVPLLATSDVLARSKAAQWLVKEQIAGACDGRRGTIDPSGVIERDLNGDGEDDLIISHEAISCGGAMSSFCGMQVCSVYFYVRRGDLLVEVHEMLGGGVEVGSGRVPKISMYAHGGRRGSVSWNGRTFQ